MRSKRLHGELVNMKPVTKGSLGQCDFPGVYLFTEGGEHLYVGRTGRQLKKPVAGTLAGQRDAPLAFRLARIATGNLKASYKADDKSRNKLVKNTEFVAAFAEQKNRIAKMSICYVRVDDPTTRKRCWKFIRPRCWGRPITNLQPPDHERHDTYTTRCRISSASVHN